MKMDNKGILISFILGLALSILMFLAGLKVGMDMRPSDMGLLWKAKLESSKAVSGLKGRVERIERKLKIKNYDGEIK